MDAFWIQLGGAAASGAIGAIVGLLIVLLERRSSRQAERRAKTERAELVRMSLIAELESIIMEMKAAALTVSKTDPAADSVPRQVLGPFKVVVFPGVVSELGYLGSGMAVRVVNLYARLQDFIDRSQQARQDWTNPRTPDQAIASVKRWMDRMRELLPEFERTLAELRKGEASEGLSGMAAARHRS